MDWVAVVQALVQDPARVLGLGLVLHQVHPLLPRAPVLGRAGRLVQGPKQAPMLGLELGRDQALDKGRVTVKAMGQEAGMENDEEAISTLLMKIKNKKKSGKKKQTKNYVLLLYGCQFSLLAPPCIRWM